MKYKEFQDKSDEIDIKMEELSDSTENCIVTAYTHQKAGDNVASKHYLDRAKNHLIEKVVILNKQLKLIDELEDGNLGVKKSILREGVLDVIDKCELLISSL